MTTPLRCPVCGAPTETDAGVDDGSHVIEEAAARIDVATARRLLDQFRPALDDLDGPLASAFTFATMDGAEVEQILHLGAALAEAAATELTERENDPAE